MRRGLSAVEPSQCAFYSVYDFPGVLPSFDTPFGEVFTEEFGALRSGRSVLDGPGGVPGEDAVCFERRQISVADRGMQGLDVGVEFVPAFQQVVEEGFVIGGCRRRQFEGPLNVVQDGFLVGFPAVQFKAQFS